jgi:acetylornithine/N-succinyldiaminopimelate aminotransferase
MSDFSTVPAEVKTLDEKYLMPTYGRLPVEFVKGSGAILTDSEGNDYIDFLGGIGCASLGHANPVVAAALKEQIDRVWQVGNYYYVENRGEAANGISTLLSRITDETGHVTGSTGTHWKTFFSNSGGEANEGAIKLARRWGEKYLDGAYGVISAKKSFHGRTLATLAATGQDVFHSTFRPMPAGFDSVPLNDIDALRAAVENPSEASGPVCAVILECVQGEGGVWPADYDYLRAVRELCDEKNLMMIVDEVQTGFFRCGAPFCFQRSGITPDIVSMAKGIADGFPMGAFAARAEVADLLHPGDHGSTFGGNALAAAAARATIDALREQEIGEHVIAVGKHLRHRLQAMPHVTEVRGRGLLRGAQLDVPVANDLVDEGLAAGLVLNHIGDSIIRFLPPLVITCEQIDEGMDRFEALLAKY